MGVMLSAASALTWITRLTNRADEASLLREIEALDDSARARSPLFLPYLSGERTPHNDAYAQGTLFGLTHEHGAAHAGYAVIEGVAFGLLDGWNVLDEGDRAQSRSLEAVGGGSRSAGWCGLIATLLDRELVRREGGEAGGALGAARLGALADGGVLEDVCRKGAAVETFEPQAARARMLRDRYERFEALYPLLRERFRDQDA
jgi:xylulokinase